MTAILATLSFAPTLSTRAAPIGAVAFADEGSNLKIIGRTEYSPLDLRPFVALFPKQVELAWAYAEWVDWLEVSLLNERMSFDEFSDQLSKPSMQALKMRDVVQEAGELIALVAERFSSAVTWPADLSTPAARGLVDQQIFSILGEMAQSQRVLNIERVPTIGWDRAVSGSHCGMVATKISGLNTAPLKTIARVLNNLPVSGADKYLVITDMPNLVAPLRQNGVESILIGDPIFVTKLSAWLASLA